MIQYCTDILESKGFTRTFLDNPSLRVPEDWILIFPSPVPGLLRILDEVKKFVDEDAKTLGFERDTMKARI